MKTIIWGLVSAILLITLVSSPSHAQGAVTCDTDYTVAAGDWMSKLAETYFESPRAYHALATQTNLKSETDFSYATIVNPDSIQVGWKLCIPNQETANALNGVNAPQGLEKSALENATYTSMVANEPVTLVNGKYEKRDDPNIPIGIMVDLTDQVAYGDLNGIPSAAVITGETGGGSGYFYLLHIMQVQDGKPVEIAKSLLGDRSPIIAILVNDNLASVDMITQGPDEPFCCATLRVINNFNLEGRDLKLAFQKELGNLGPNGETPGAALAVTGEVLYRERIAMPEGAVVTVRVSDVSKMDVAAELIGEQIITDPGNVPVKYSVPYDGSKIIPGNRYAVSARIEVNGQLMWISTTNIPVITNDAPTSGVEILVERVGGTTTFPPEAAPSGPAHAPAGSLTGVVWEWQGTKYNYGIEPNPTPANPSAYTLQFGDDNRIAAQADCNQAGGPYSTRDGDLSIGPLISTLALCPPGSLSSEYLRDLEDAAAYFFDGDNLVIALKEGRGLVTFAPAQEATTLPASDSLTGTVWKWQGTTTPVEEIKPDDPNHYTVEFLEDGKVQIKADCNTGAGTYAADNGSLTMGPIALTKVFCGEQSKDTVFVSQLQNAALYFFADGNLMIDQIAAGGTMKFSK